MGSGLRIKGSVLGESFWTLFIITELALIGE